MYLQGEFYVRGSLLRGHPCRGSEDHLTYFLFWTPILTVCALDVNYYCYSSPDTGVVHSKYSRVGHAQMEKGSECFKDVMFFFWFSCLSVICDVQVHAWFQNCLRFGQVLTINVYKSMWVEIWSLVEMRMLLAALLITLLQTTVKLVSKSVWLLPHGGIRHTLKRAGHRMFGAELQTPKINISSVEYGVLPVSNNCVFIRYFWTK